MHARLQLARKLAFFDTALQRRRGIYQCTPLIASEYIYVSHANPSVVRRQLDGEVVALDRHTLATQWRVKTDKLGAYLQWDENILIVIGTEYVAALDIANRKILWTMYSALGRYRWSDIFLTFDSGRRTLVEVDVHTGEQRPILTTPAQVSWSIVSANTLIYTLENDALMDQAGMLRGLDLRTGSVAWERDLLSEIRFGHGADCTYLLPVPGSVGGNFVVTAGANTFGCAVEDGRILWKADVPVSYGWPLVERGRIPILTHVEFVVLDEATGEVLCRRKHGLLDILHPRPGSLVSEDVFGTVTEEGHVMLFDMHTAELLASARHGVYFQRTAAADGRFFVAGGDGKLWVYEPFG